MTFSPACTWYLARSCSNSLAPNSSVHLKRLSQSRSIALLCGGKPRRQCTLRGINISNDSGNFGIPPLKALRDAVRTGEIDALETLLRSGVLLDLNHGPGRNALMEAAEEGHIAVVEFLAGMGANLDAQNGYGRTAAMEAARMGHADVLIVLRDAGADLNVQNKNGLTALMYAAESGHDEAIKVLVVGGAAMDAQRGRQRIGATAAILAASKGHYGALQILMSAGANMSIRRDSDHKTALELHRESVDRDIRHFLEQADMISKGDQGCGI
ncbi:hypothetical protein CYMTET_8736 [Cymbomonas tetramitiformis]|uniref:Ankyrin repeat domain-containing protein n=1 Tax=Cymbomonas tetramitiformis TaxID=36881 RepID=A0AAE0GSJ8_9CHLO|nr:hypothetical protein CYMTET_8736 [Cymbomonas tetramitiformis]